MSSMPAGKVLNLAFYLIHFFGQVLLPSLLICLLYLISNRRWFKTLTSGLPSLEVLPKPFPVPDFFILLKSEAVALLFLCKSA